jgi:hypothetical protein
VSESGGAAVFHWVPHKPVTESVSVGWRPRLAVFGESPCKYE